MNVIDMRVRLMPDVNVTGTLTSVSRNFMNVIGK